MTLDSSLPPSIADENAPRHHDPSRFPKGIHITEADTPSAPGIEAMPAPQPKPWGYLLIHNRQVELFQQQMEAYNHAHPEAPHACFVHYSTRYKQKRSGHGVLKEQRPTISGLVFLQGDTRELQAFLRANYPQHHLIRNCSTGRPASIADSVMQPFMRLVEAHPENVTFLRDPFVKFARDHTRLRVLTGIFRGLEGYIVRVDRDRQLVMELGGYAVAIRGLHNEDFAVAD